MVQSYIMVILKMCFTFVSCCFEWT